jgi:hypothetical protein
VVRISARSSAFSTIRSYQALRMRLRSLAGRLAQSFCTSAAASMARRAAAASRAGTATIGAPSKGSVTAKLRPSAAAIHSPAT